MYVVFCSKMKNVVFMSDNASVMEYMIKFM